MDTEREGGMEEAKICPNVNADNKIHTYSNNKNNYHDKRQLRLWDDTHQNEGDCCCCSLSHNSVYIFLESEASCVFSMPSPVYLYQFHSIHFHVLAYSNILHTLKYQKHLIWLFSIIQLGFFILPEQKLRAFFVCGLTKSKSVWAAGASIYWLSFMLYASFYLQQPSNESKDLIFSIACF